MAENNKKETKNSSRLSKFIFGALVALCHLGFIGGLGYLFYEQGKQIKEAERVPRVCITGEVVGERYSITSTLMQTYESYAISVRTEEYGLKTFDVRGSNLPGLDSRINKGDLITIRGIPLESRHINFHPPLDGLDKKYIRISERQISEDN